MKRTQIQTWQVAQIFAVILLALSARAWGQAPAANGPKRQVVVSIPDRKLAVLQDGNVLRTFPVAVGATVSPSPAGGFQVANRVANPAYYHPGIVIPPGKSNPLGPRWIGLNKKGYGIHGTNEPRSIGKAASHGCIRLRNRDVQELFAMVSVGDVVEIRGERDPQTDELFGVAAVTTQDNSGSGSGDIGGGQ
jgi:lipoprotein-anchoring transpeptidase ErfK/SrfK